MTCGRTIAVVLFVEISAIQVVIDLNLVDCPVEEQLQVATFERDYKHEHCISCIVKVETVVEERCLRT